MPRLAGCGIRSGYCLRHRALAALRGKDSRRAEAPASEALEGTGTSKRGRLFRAASLHHAADYSAFFLAFFFAQG